MGDRARLPSDRRAVGEPRPLTHERGSPLHGRVCPLPESLCHFRPASKKFILAPQTRSYAGFYRTPARSASEGSPRVPRSQCPWPTVGLPVAHCRFCRVPLLACPAGQLRHRSDAALPRADASLIPGGLGDLRGAVQRTSCDASRPASESPAKPNSLRTSPSIARRPSATGRRPPSACHATGRAPGVTTEP